MPQTQSSKAAEEAALHNFQKSLAAFDKHLNSDELAQAAVVLRTALSLSRTSAQHRQLIEPYARVILSCALSIQTSALHCGNILPEHLVKMRFAQHCARRMRKLAASCQNGLAEITAAVLSQNAALGTLCAARHQERKRFGITSASELNDLLSAAAALAEESRNLIEGPKGADDRKLRLQAARDAVSNASYCIPRWIFAPDFAKAEVLCTHSKSLLLQHFSGQQIDERLASAVCSIDVCVAELKKADKNKSRKMLEATHKLLLAIK